MAREKKRLQDLQDLLGEEEIDVDHLRLYCSGGIPDKPGTRSLCWKLILGFLPSNKSVWNDALAKSRQQYKDFINDFIVQRQKVDSHPADDASDPLGALSSPDTGQSQHWDDYFKENQVLDQINKDVRRLNPDFAFFQQTSPCPRPSDDPLSSRVQRQIDSATVEVSRSGVASLRRKQSDTSVTSDGQDNEELHWEVIERILFIYAKLNPGIAYVQGMNEILGPIYYCFATDPDTEWRLNAEADTFFCFMNLMSEIRDVFIKTLDRSDTGIGALMARLTQILSEFRPHIHAALEDMSLQPQFYAFRWLTLLLSQEFKLPELMRLWDTLFSSTDRLACMLNICVAMLELVSDTLEERDFATTLKMLQSYPQHIDAVQILMCAEQLELEMKRARTKARYGTMT